jgi:SAM-dependent methyltransferase
MEYKKLREDIRTYSSQDLEQRKRWYSPAAVAYNQARPRYPKEVIDQVVAIAQLSSTSTVLEVGCGPGTATVSFAPLGCSMLCLEPNPDFYLLAQQNCAAYPNVTFQNTSFEEWPQHTDAFDVVIAASSFHWIPADIGYSKAANALRDNGHLILMWNKELQPTYEVYQRFSPIYKTHAPELDRYEDQETQDSILRGLGQMALDSSYFHNVVAGQIVSNVTYTTDDYLTLLNTYSPYLKLDPQRKAALFAGLKYLIDQDLDGSIPLSFVSAFHVANKQ